MSDAQHLHWGHYRCKSQSQMCFMTPALVFQAGPLRQVSRRGLANQDGKREMGGQVAPLSCQHCPSSPLTPPTPLLLLPPDHSSAICAPISHFHRLILLPVSLSPCLSLSLCLSPSMLDEDIAPHLCLILEHLLPAATGCLQRAQCIRGFCVNWVKLLPVQTTGSCKWNIGSNNMQRKHCGVS